MPINSPRRMLGRKQVAWLGSPPPDDARKAFEERDYLVTQCSYDDLVQPAYLAGLSAVVFSQSPDKPLQVAKDLEKYAKVLLDHDCLAILRPGSLELSETPTIIANALAKLRIWTAGLPIDEAAKFVWQDPVGSVPPPPYAVFFSWTIPWFTIANAVAANPPGPPPNAALAITPTTVESGLSADSRLLLQRAFADCADLHLEAIEEGNSGVSVYRAHAELAQGVLGMWPQPYFVKIGDRFKIYQEYKIYEERVDPYIPFHLGPHLIRERCCLGASKGLIVGDFVEESESLRDCACEGRAAAAIACLFDRTLLGWHRSPNRVQRSMAAGLAGFFPRKIDPPRFALAEALGATRSLGQLRSLFDCCTSEPVLAGPVHGDLHAANVRVRATDAIVIDFFAHRDFPLVYDAASLEASLLVEGFADDKRSIEEWQRSLASLYRASLFERTLLHPSPKDPSSWFHACIRQIRRYARQWECGENQYAGALAVALLIKATKDKQAAEPEASRRAVAYVFAEKLLVETFGSAVVADSAIQPVTRQAQ